MNFDDYSYEDLCLEYKALENTKLLKEVSCELDNYLLHTYEGGGEDALEIMFNMALTGMGYEVQYLDVEYECMSPYREDTYVSYSFDIGDKSFSGDIFIESVVPSGENWMSYIIGTVKQHSLPKRFGFYCESCESTDKVANIKKTVDVHGWENGTFEINEDDLKCITCGGKVTYKEVV